MKADKIASIANAFSERAVLSKAELLRWLHTLYPAASEPTLTWRISDLKHRGILDNPGRGMYRLSEVRSFTPSLGPVSKRIAARLTRQLPLIRFCIWETRWVGNWMQLQAPAN